jgi:hypothetical protein
VCAFLPAVLALVLDGENERDKGDPQEKIALLLRIPFVTFRFSS